MKSIVITCALPYANGDLHLGYMLECVLADVFVRAKRMQGYNVHFICAEDTHGTPIEVNAMKQNITPEELIERTRVSHVADLESYNISFDEFYTTHSEENKQYAENIFLKLRENGFIAEKEIEQLFCNTDNRFLPDRFIKGECPFCSAKDQYGDICESCGRTYNPEQLKDAYCILCNNAPVLKKSKHYFFELSKTSDELRNYIDNHAELQKETKNYVSTWIEKGLQDWDITRDGPYFGFKIPGETDKYFYVWLDAPIGYLSSLEHYKKRTGIDKDLWQESQIIHVIGKDIMYFHLLFWPAVLMHSGFKVPDKIQVHGFLTVEGEKMSKSRGTFILAKDMKQKIEPDLIRYYLASQLNTTINDIDYSQREMQNKINHELISNLMNMYYRIGSLIDKKKTTSKADNIDMKLISNILEKHNSFLESAALFEHSTATKHLMSAGDIINKYIQDNKPWALEDPSIILRNAYYAALVTLPSLYCIMPSTADKIAQQLGISVAYVNEIIEKHKSPEEIISELEKLQRNDSITVSPKIIYQRLEIEGKTNAEDSKEKKQKAHPFENLNLKVAKIIGVESHPDANSLYVLKLEIGKEQRQIVSGLKEHYAEDELKDRMIVIVENMKPATIRGVASEGMLLAGSIKATDDKEAVILLSPPKEANSGDSVHGEKQNKNSESSIGLKATIKDVQRSEMHVKNKIMWSPFGKLITKSGNITVDLPDDARIS